MPSPIKREMVRRLNELCFRDIWNAIRAEYRVNIKLTPVRDRFVSGTLQHGSDTLALPGAGAFAAFTTEASLFFGALAIEPGVWFTAAQLLTKLRTLYHTYPVSGHLLPLSSVWFYRSARTERVYVAADAAAVVKIMGPTAWRTMYTTVYRDSDQPHDIGAWSFHVDAGDPTAVRAAITSRLGLCRAANAAGTMLFINGVEVDSGQAFSTAVGDYVQIILDANVVGAYTVNLDLGNTGYFSVRDAAHKELLHCPKALNPLNRLITHNTCTLFLRANGANRGLYFHRTDDRSVSQVTHNDLGVLSADVDALRAHLGTPHVSMHVRVRTHSKDNVLLPDLAHIAHLYSCDDATIVRHLRGELDASLDFWTAAALEQSGYVALMFDTPRTLVDSVLATYVNSLGYYQVAALLARHVQHRALPDSGRGPFTFSKPFALAGAAVTALVYLDGHKVRAPLAPVADDGASVRVTLDSSVQRTAGQVLSVDLLEGGPGLPYVYTVDPEAPVVTVPYPAVAVWVERPLETPAEGQTVTASAAYAAQGFLAGTLEAAAVSGGTQLTFGPSLHNKRVLVQPTTFVRSGSVNVDAAIAAKAPFVLSLQADVVNTDDVVPLLGHSALELYVNGKRLVDGVEATAAPLMVEGGVALLEAVITAVEYFTDQPNNVIEWVAHTDAALKTETGYVVDNALSYDNKLTLWYDGLSRAFARGVLLTDAVDRGTHLTTGQPLSTGAPYLIATSVAPTAAAALGDFSDFVDAQRLAAINRYFQRQGPPNPGTIEVTASHRLYSPYVMTIAQDILSGAFVPVNDPDPVAFLAQFAPYAYLKERDPTVHDPAGRLDLRFVDAYPSYAQLTVSNPHFYAIIKRLGDLVLPVDTTTTGDLQR